MKYTLAKRKLLQNCKLYLILDAEVSGYDTLLKVAKQAILGGVDIIQLRDKFGSARDIIRFSDKIMGFTKYRVPYIINDRVDIVQIIECHGVHVGQEDIPVGIARKILGPKKIIGVSCQTLEHCRKALNEGADYIGFGSVFKTKTKPDRQPMGFPLLKDVLQKISMPVFPIGGINRTNFISLKGIGVEKIAVCRAICEAKDVKDTTRFFKKHLLG